MQYVNQNYYAYDYTIEVMDIKKAVEESKVVVDKASGLDEVKDKVDDIFNNFKDSSEENVAFKTMSIILGTILGLALIYVIYLIIHKIHKWLKK